MLNDLLMALMAADEPAAPRMPRLLALMTDHPGFLAGLVMTLFALGGLALFAALIAPERQRLALDGLRLRSGRSLLLGLAVLLVPATGLVLLGQLHIGAGRGLLAAVVLVGAAIGLAVSARALAERALADVHPVAQTAIGLAALLLPALIPLGWPVPLVAAALGLGAWLSARRDAG